MVEGSPNASKSFWYLDQCQRWLRKRNGWEEVLYRVLVVASEDRVVLRTDFGHNNVRRRPLVKDSARVGASEHREQRVLFNIL